MFVICLMFGWRHVNDQNTSVSMSSRPNTDLILNSVTRDWPVYSK
jgi:hypothetical protein